MAEKISKAGVLATPGGLPLPQAQQQRPGERSHGKAPRSIDLIMERIKRYPSLPDIVLNSFLNLRFRVPLGLVLFWIGLIAPFIPHHGAYQAVALSHNIKACSGP